MGDIGPRTMRYEVLPTHATPAPADAYKPVAAVEAPAAPVEVTPVDVTPVDLTGHRTVAAQTGPAGR